MTHTKTARNRKNAQTLLVALLLGAAALLSVATSHAPPPVIDRITPDLGSSSVPVDQPLTVELERPANPDTVTSESVRLRRLSDDTLVEATLELAESNHQIILRPISPLAPRADYALELDLSGLADSNGERYAGLRYDESHSAVWETSGLLSVPFTTRQNLTVGRAFVTTDPDELILYFSEAVDAEALTVEALSLRGEAGPVTVDLRYNDVENRLRILPLSPLEPGRSYTLTLSPDITTPDGARLAGGAGEQLSFQVEDERIR